MAAEQEKPVTAISKDELVAALEHSRRAISMGLPALGAACNPIHRLRQSFTRHPTRWITCSALLGLAGTSILASSASSRRLPKGEPPRNSFHFRLAPLLLFALKSAVAVARPAATRAVQKRLNQMLE